MHINPPSHKTVPVKRFSNIYEYTLASEDDAENILTDAIEADSLIEAYTKVLEVLDMINKKATSTKFEISTISRMTNSLRII